MSLASLSLRAVAGGSQMVARHAAGGLIRKVTPHAHRPQNWVEPPKTPHGTAACDRAAPALSQRRHVVPGARI